MSSSCRFLLCLFFYSAFSISPSLFLSLGFDLSSSDLINMESIWGKGGVRSVCASAFIRGWPRWGPWHSSIKRREDEQGRGGRGPPSAAVLGFRVLTPLAVPGCVSLLSVHLTTVVQVDKTITASHLSYARYINFCLSECLLALRPSFTSSVILIPIVCLSFLAFSFPWSGETLLRGEGRGGVLASLSGASGNLISQQRQTEKRRAGGNLSFTDCIFNTEVIFYRHWIWGCICTHRHTQGTHLYVYTLEKHISCPPLVM